MFGSTPQGTRTKSFRKSLVGMELNPRMNLRTLAASIPWIFGTSQFSAKNRSSDARPITFSYNTTTSHSFEIRPFSTRSVLRTIWNGWTKFSGRIRELGTIDILNWRPVCVCGLVAKLVPETEIFWAAEFVSASASSQCFTFGNENQSRHTFPQFRGRQRSFVGTKNLIWDAVETYGCNRSSISLYPVVIWENPSLSR